MPLRQLFRGVGVIEADHGTGELVCGEIGSRDTADTLCRRIRGYEFGMLLLQLLEFPHELVELEIGDCRAVQNVVSVFVIADRHTEVFDPRSEAFHTTPECRRMRQ